MSAAADVGPLVEWESCDVGTPYAWYRYTDDLRKNAQSLLEIDI